MFFAKDGHLTSRIEGFDRWESKERIHMAGLAGGKAQRGRASWGVCRAQRTRKRSAEPEGHEARLGRLTASLLSCFFQLFIMKAF